MYPVGTKVKVIYGGCGSSGCDGKIGTVVSIKEAQKAIDEEHCHGHCSEVERDDIFHIKFTGENVTYKYQNKEGYYEVWGVKKPTPQDKTEYKVLRPDAETTTDVHDNTIIYAGKKTIVFLNPEKYGTNGKGRPYKGVAKYTEEQDFPFDKDRGYKIAFYRAIQKHTNRELNLLIK